jgi:hypothetical protein
VECAIIAEGAGFIYNSSMKKGILCRFKMGFRGYLGFNKINLPCLLCILVFPYFNYLKKLKNIHSSSSLSIRKCVNKGAGEIPQLKKQFLNMYTL